MDRGVSKQRIGSADVRDKMYTDKPCVSQLTVTLQPASGEPQTSGGIASRKRFNDNNKVIFALDDNDFHDITDMDFTESESMFDGTSDDLMDTQRLRKVSMGNVKDLANLVDMTTRLNLNHRRPSLVAWKEKNLPRISRTCESQNLQRVDPMISRADDSTSCNENLAPMERQRSVSLLSPTRQEPEVHFLWNVSTFLCKLISLFAKYFLCVNI